MPLPMPGKEPGKPSICLLDVAGKLFERIVANQITCHLSQECPELAESQYGFRVGKSAMDVLDRVVTKARVTTRQDGIVSLNIVNF